MRHCSDGMVGTPRVLDVGCGRGQLLEAFKESGAIVTGLERQENKDAQGNQEVIPRGPITR